MRISHPMLWVAATRPAFLSVTLVAVMLGLATARYNGVYHSTWLAGVTLLFALVAHAGANVLNDYFDALSGCDAANTERIYPFTGGSRFIQDGLLSTRQTALFGYALLFAVIPAGLYLVSQSGIGLILIGFCGLFAGWAYSATPLKLQSRGIGEITITLAWTLIVVGSDYVQRGTFAAAPIIAGLAYGLLVANVLFINQVPDVKADAATGKYTIIVRFGATIAPLGSALLYISSTAVLALGITLGTLPKASAVALLFWSTAAFSLKALKTAGENRSLLTQAIKLTIMSCLLFGVLFCVTLIDGALKFNLRYLAG